jgi:16S rRNA U516 pseudouridylate synthase RsuA-like enzyme
VRLVCVRIGPIALDTLPIRTWRLLSAAEVQAITGGSTRAAKPKRSPK